MSPRECPLTAHRRRSGISRLTDPTAVDRPLLRARSSCPRTDLGVRSEGLKVEWVTSSARSRYRRRIRDAEGARKHYGAACPDRAHVEDVRCEHFNSLRADR